MLNPCIRTFRAALFSLGVSVSCLIAIVLLNSFSVVPYVFAALFWLSLVTELVLLCVTNHKRKKVNKKNPGLKQSRPKGLIGLCSFTQNTEAAVADLLLLLSAVYCIVIIDLRINSKGGILLGICSIYAFFHLHCILNGIIYKSIKHYKSVTQKKESKK